MPPPPLPPPLGPRHALPPPPALALTRPFTLQLKLELLPEDHVPSDDPRPAAPGREPAAVAAANGCAAAGGKRQPDAEEAAAAAAVLAAAPAEAAGEAAGSTESPAQKAKRAKRT